MNNIFGFDYKENACLVYLNISKCIQFKFLVYHSTSLYSIWFTENKGSY